LASLINASNLNDQIKKFLDRSLYVSNIKSKSVNSKKINRGVIYYIRSAFYCLNDFICLNCFLKNKIDKPLIFISYSISRENQLDDYYSPYVVPISESMVDRKVINLEDGFVGNKSNIYKDTQEYTLAVYYQAIRGMLLAKRILYTIFGKIPFINFYKNYDYRIDYIFTHKRFYKYIFRKFNPEIVFQINWYGARGIAVNLAAQEMGIKSVDVQHGLAASAEHRCYTDLASVDKRIVPSYFLSWSKNDAIMLNADLGQNIAHATGSLPLYVKSRPSVIIADDTDTHALIVLGISFPDWLLGLIDELKLLKLNCVVRPHPHFPLKDHGMIGLAQAHVRVEVKQSFRECLSANPTIVIGEWSAGLVEASLLGIPAVSIGKEGAQFFKDIPGITSFPDINDCTDEIRKVITTEKHTLVKYADYHHLETIISEIIASSK
jgi:hypothetical protein